MCAAGNKKANWFLSAAGNSRRATPSSPVQMFAMCALAAGKGGLGYQDSLACSTGTAWGCHCTPFSLDTEQTGVGVPVHSTYGALLTWLTPILFPPHLGLTPSVDIWPWVLPCTPNSLPHGTACLSDRGGWASLSPECPSQNLRFWRQVPITVFCPCPLATGDHVTQF